MTIVFDPCDFHPESFRIRPQRMTLSGPVSLSGVQQVQSMPGGLWVAEFGAARLNSRERLLAWRQFVARARGGSREFEVLLQDKRQGPWPVAAGRRVYTPGGIVCTVTANAELNDTVIGITMTSGGTPEPGQHFSITGPDLGKRLYRLVEVTDLTGGLYTVEIETGLREDITAATAVNFETPGCTMRVANPDEIEPPVRLGKQASSSVVFVESFSE
jgi:hypothetical protein